MRTEEFVLIPGNMFTTEQPQDPTARNESKQLSLLQRTLKQEQPETVIHQNTEQQTDEVMVSDEEEKEQKITDEFKQKKFDEISQNVIDDINFREKDKLEKSKITLNQSRKPIA